MKRHFYILIILFFLSLNVVGQARKEVSRLHFGIKGGPILQSFILGAVKHTLSYQIGGTARMQLNKTNNIQAELLLSNLRTENFQNYYIHVPLIYKREVYMDLSLELGPQINFNLYNNFDFDILRPVDLGYCFGFSRELSGASYINFRYSRNLTPIFKNRNVKSSLLALTLVLEFN